MRTVRLKVDGFEVQMAQDASVAAAVAKAGVAAYRRSVSGEARAPLCGMGICYECRVTIDGRPHVLSCQIICEDGMEVTTG